MHIQQFLFHTRPEQAAFRSGNDLFYPQSHWLQLPAGQLPPQLDPVEAK